MAVLLGAPCGWTAATGASPLLASPPSKLSWHDILDLDIMHCAPIPRGGGPILFTWRPVETGASVRFRPALDAARPIDEIWRYSPGGDLDAGLEIGRMIHARRPATHLVRGQRCVGTCDFSRTVRHSPPSACGRAATMLAEPRAPLP